MSLHTIITKFGVGSTVSPSTTIEHANFRLAGSTYRCGGCGIAKRGDAYMCTNVDGCNKLFCAVPFGEQTRCCAVHFFDDELSGCASSDRCYTKKKPGPNGSRQRSYLNPAAPGRFEGLFDRPPPQTENRRSSSVAAELTNITDVETLNDIMEGRHSTSLVDHDAAATRMPTEPMLPDGSTQSRVVKRIEASRRQPSVTYDDDANNQQTTDALLGRVTTELDNYQCSPGNARWNLSRTSRVEGDDNAVTVDGGFTVDEIAEQLKSFEAIIDSFWKQMPTTMQFMMAVSRQNETQSALLLFAALANRSRELNFVKVVFSLLFYLRGAPKSVIDLFHQTGGGVSYSTLIKVIHRSGDSWKLAVNALMQRGECLVIWDNFNKGYVDDSVRGMMHNMIVAAVAPMQPVLENVLLADKPICCATKLNVSMLLCTSEFDIARQRHALSDQIATTLYSIYFPHAVAPKLNSWRSFTAIDGADVVIAPVIPESQTTTAGSFKAHAAMNDILKNPTHLIMVGDQMSHSHSNTIATISGPSSRNVVPILALWHTQVSVLNALLKIFKAEIHQLVSSLDTKRTGSYDPDHSNFAACDRLIRVALRCLIDQSCSTSSFDSIDQLNDTIRNICDSVTMIDDESPLFNRRAYAFLVCATLYIELAESISNNQPARQYFALRSVLPILRHANNTKYSIAVVRSLICQLTAVPRRVALSIQRSMVVIGRCGKLLASDMWCEANAIKLLKVHLGANVSSEASIVGRCNMLIGCLPSLREIADVAFDVLSIRQHDTIATTSNAVKANDYESRIRIVVASMWSLMSEQRSKATQLNQKCTQMKIASSFSMGDMFADTYGWLYAIVSSRRHLSDVLYAMEENENNEEEDTAVLPVGDVQ